MDEGKGRVRWYSIPPGEGRDGMAGEGEVPLVVHADRPCLNTAHCSRAAVRCSIFKRWPGKGASLGLGDTERGAREDEGRVGVLRAEEAELGCEWLVGKRNRRRIAAQNSSSAGTMLSRGQSFTASHRI